MNFTIDRLSPVVANAGRSNGFVRVVIVTLALAVSACVSDADPRDDSDDFPDGRPSADVRDGALDARSDAQDAPIRQDLPVGDDAGEGSVDATADLAIDTPSDGSAVDIADTGNAVDTGGADIADAMDVSAEPPAIDASVDTGAGDGDASIDTLDVNTGLDVVDAGSPIDANDAAAPIDASDAALDGTDASAPDVAGDAGNTSDAGDASDAGTAADAGDGGLVVFYQENFDTTLGTFSNPSNTCGPTTAQWSVVGGYAHAADPMSSFVSRIVSQPVTVPASMSNITLRMSHKFNTEAFYDAGTLLVSIDSAAPIQVTTFTTGGYTSGGATNPTTCTVSANPSVYPGWSGNHTEWTSEVNLSAAPFNAVANSTVTITFRMATDNTVAGSGWDINWVSLSGTSP